MGKRCHTPTQPNLIKVPKPSLVPRACLLMTSSVPLLLHLPLSVPLFPVLSGAAELACLLPWASSHPLLHAAEQHFSVWPLLLLHQFCLQGLLTVPTRTWKNLKLGKRGSGIGFASNSQVIDSYGY